jgi:hypothetical protein
MDPNWIDIAVKNVKRDARHFPAWFLTQLPTEEDTVSDTNTKEKNK